MIFTKQKAIVWLSSQPDNKQFEIKEKKEKRSLDANAYCWVLCDIIAKELNKDGTIILKEEVYKDCILQIGKFTAEIWQEKDFDYKKKDWESRGLGFLVQEVMRKDRCIKVHCYYGSSTYDTEEMSLMIGLLVQLATDLNLETRQKGEIQSLLDSWR